MRVEMRHSTLPVSQEEPLEALLVRPNESLRSESTDNDDLNPSPNWVTGVRFRGLGYLQETR